MVNEVPESNVFKGILDWIGNAVWSVISGFLSLLWRIITDYWYVLLTILIIALGIWIIVGFIQDKKDEKWLRRHGYSAAADDKLREIAERVCDSFRRVELESVSYSIVRIRVESQTGNSTWDCSIDFNDHGRITGAYKITSSNKRSSMPEHVAEEIASEIKSLSVEELYS